MLALVHPSIVKSAITFLVSSRHLTLASPIFKAMLAGPWSDSDKQGERMKVFAQEWDTDAFLVALRVMHCQHRGLPDSVNFKMLASISMIVDYHEIHDDFCVICALVD